MSISDLINFLARYQIAVIVTFFVLFAVAEMIIPRSHSRGRVGFRWFTNIGMTLLNIVLFRAAGPLIAVLTSLSAGYLGFGLFNNIELGLALTLLLGIVTMDLKQYLFHRLMHYSDFLWRIHRVHHSEIELDLTSGFRFHPFEVILSSLLDIAVIAVFGLGYEVILLRYLLIYLVNFFTHGNIYLPPAIDRGLQWVLVTPSMHHLHHAMEHRAANSNFGVAFSIWDRLFGSYLQRHPETGSDYLYGLREYRDADKLNLWSLLAMPFRPASENPQDRPRD